MTKQVRRWLPGRRLVLVVDGGFAAVSLALACAKRKVVMVSRLRWDAALYHPPGPQPPGRRGPKPTQGQRQRSPREWAVRSDTPWETGEVDWYGGQRKQLWVFSRTALWYTPEEPPVDIRYVLVADPEGKLRMDAFFCKVSQDGHIPVPVTAWYHKTEPTLSDCLALVRRHHWRARYLVNAAPEAELRQFPPEALDLLIHGVPFAA
jgi:hypothetical protein